MKNDIKSNSKLLNTRILVLVVVFLLMTLISLIILFDRLGMFTGTNPSTVVSIATSSVSSNETPSTSSVRTTKTEETPDTVLAFVARDDVTIWKTETEVDLFKSDYTDPTDTKITVVGNGDKVIAPGTEYEYDFYVENNSNYAVDYTLTGEAYFSEEDLTIPVDVKLHDHDGVYLVGTETSWTPVYSLNELATKRTLAANSYTKYTLHWEWPFERGEDQYDTLLGDLAAQESTEGDLSTETEFTLTIMLNTSAELNTNPNAQGGEKINTNPKTGDEFPVIMWTIAASVSFVAMFVIVLVYVFKRRREDTDEA